MMDWATLEQSCKHCQRCGLADCRTQVVFGQGQGSVLVVGLAPGPEEDATGKPFQGPLGKTLDDLFSVIDLRRNTNLYYTYLVKCTPIKQKKPLQSQAKSCLQYLRGQVALLRPKIILCLGADVAEHLMHKGFDIQKDHGVFYEKAKVWMMALPDPTSFDKDPNGKLEFLRDLNKVEEKIQEIS